ncbi:uncharacterized protein PFL1_04604 [Pseudozyma flocculosa PF-1]|uniref:Related to RRP4 - 3`-5` exoribonuclease n=2 Tax=Pseudozyma flocculosa TaxID=84751 RepID=A0A5C3FC29_9BASI|nr:uncharacterized protein PFL1_04604 [Pseudozyma flocculosa PF-1]EPQ27860.1 hypothetical protein PFL1_04604 [Pseudozyma flocculosa PF-1]SPO41011.1 related to RRP4 - 3`-5` exoribonuclease [Pseudozyma flocculosa]
MSAATQGTSTNAGPAAFTVLTSRKRRQGSAGPSTSYHVHHSGARHPCSSSSASSSSSSTKPGYALDALSAAHLGHGDAMDMDDDPTSADDGGDGATTIAVPGEPLASSSLFMRGHGTTLSSTGTITSTVAGTLVLTNKLLSIPPIRSRYIPEIGDLVIGQVTSLSPKRWKVDIHSRSDASLQLSSINLPGGVQRRKLESDELQMRNFFKEDDWVVAEVQSVFHDGTVGLHTRSLRYGKLRNGTVQKVEAGRVKRLKSHFCDVTLAPPRAGHDEAALDRDRDPGRDAAKPVKLDLILGLNGYIWIAKHVPFSLSKAEGTEGQGMAGTGTGRDVDAVYTDDNEEIDTATRAAISTARKVIAILDAWCVPISDVAVERAYETLVELHRGEGDVEPEVQRIVVESTLEAVA